jgi:hypothetical protein
VGITAAVLLSILVVAFLLTTSNPAPVPKILFAGYTNLPGSNTRFALITIENTDLLPLRWRGNSVEVHGEIGFKAPTINSRLPWFDSKILKGQSEITVAVGEPSGSRWRLVLRFSRYTPREWLRDLQLKYDFLARIPVGPLEIQTITSQWSAQGNPAL